jgi:DNA polymerase
VSVPAAYGALAQSVVLHSDPARFGLLYRLLWRLQTEPGLRHDTLDADWVRLSQMAQAVRRDMHKMKAFVRFRTVREAAREGDAIFASAGVDVLDVEMADAPDSADGGDDDTTATAPPAVPAALSVDWHVAWFEPEHHVVEAVAPFFVRRFTGMRWAILTPKRSLHWDGARLSIGPGARRDQAPPADAGEALWLTYYKSIFNPARLKLAMMQKEMPRRYWKNLPEATLIDGLAAQAAERTTNMIENDPTERPARAASPAVASAAATRAARPAAGGDPAASLPGLASALDRCRECPIGFMATQGVPGEGPVRAPLMFVGEQPGDQEDLQGRPFVGPAGQLFDRAMHELGITRRDTYVTNAVKHFKFELRGKRRIHKTPAQQEAAACLHWLESEIALVDPEALVALGATAARSLMGMAVPVLRNRGQWLTRADGRRVLVTLHPSALLRMEPEVKDRAWADWLADLRQAKAVLGTA